MYFVDELIRKLTLVSRCEVGLKRGEERKEGSFAWFASGGVGTCTKEKGNERTKRERETNS